MLLVKDLNPVTSLVLPEDSTLVLEDVAAILTVGHYVSWCLQSHAELRIFPL